MYLHKIPALTGRPHPFQASCRHLTLSRVFIPLLSWLTLLVNSSLLTQVPPFRNPRVSPRPFASLYIFLSTSNLSHSLTAKWMRWPIQWATIPIKRNFGIKKLRVGCHVEVIHLEGRIGYEVALNVEFCQRLTYYDRDSASDYVSLLSSAVKYSTTGTILAYSSNGPKNQKEKSWYMPDAKCCPSSDTEDPREVKAETDPAVTVPVENDIGTLFASPGMKKLFKKNFVTKMV